MHILSWSGGKDSTAQVILAHLHNEPIDYIIYSEVMYSLERNISGEHPEHVNFIWNVAKPLFESWGYKVLILRSENIDFISFFNHIIKKGKDISHIGMKYGFPIAGLCGIKRDCKIKPIDNFKKSLGEQKIINYIGIAIDELERLESLHKNPNSISLLEKYGLTEADAKKLCVEYNLLSPTYKYSKRGGCWFCPNSKDCECEAVMKKMPDVWNEYVSLEKEDIAFKKWNCYSDETLLERSNRIKENMKYTQIDLFDYMKEVKNAI